jgi:hypothetical protein
MSRQSEAAAIRRLESEYSPATEFYELEEWLGHQLYDTYHNLHGGEPELFRFREAVLLYVPTTELINATRLVYKDVTEHCVILSGFLYKNYGIRNLGNRADVEMQLMLSEHDFDLMALQIASDLIAWYDNVSLMLSVSARQQKQHNP